MKQKINRLVDEMKPVLIATYRDFHQYPEPGWTEFRTAAAVVKKLQSLGLAVSYGADVIDAEGMMGVPPDEILVQKQEQAISQGADPGIVKEMSGGKTGVVAVLDTGIPGPTIAFRVDMDANDIDEAKDEKHKPYLEGFASVNEGAMHACGHDAHTAMGLGLAALLVELKDELKGKIKIIFQPAEEGVRGAKSMVQAGVVEDVDYMMGVHVGVSSRRLGQIVCGGEGFLATTKQDVSYTGVPSHAGAEPQNGKNALLAAATAAVNLHAITRHSKGATRINVGTIRAGSGRNVIPAAAELKIETRGADTELNRFMEEKALDILQGAAKMHDLQFEVREMGGALGGTISRELIPEVIKAAAAVPEIDDIKEYGSAGGSEDFSFFMDRVQESGGKAIYSLLGTELAAGHHNQYFAINEEVVPMGVKFMGQIAYAFAHELPKLKQ